MSDHYVHRRIHKLWYQLRMSEVIQALSRNDNGTYSADAAEAIEKLFQIKDVPVEEVIETLDKKHLYGNRLGQEFRTRCGGDIHRFAGFVRNALQCQICYPPSGP